jgi:hypothetical protein
MPNTKKGDNMKKTKPTEDDNLLDTLSEMDLVRGQGVEVLQLQIKHQQQALKFKNQIIHKKDQIIEKQEELIEQLTIKLREQYITDTDGVKNQNAVSRARLPEKNNEERR